MGVEGMTPGVIEDALRRAGATVEGESSSRTAGAITKQDLMALGLSGGQGSSQKRLESLKKLLMVILNSKISEQLKALNT